MIPYEGMGYPAVTIEHAFAAFLGERIGQRGEAWDADVFRGGYTKSIGSALKSVAGTLRQRVDALPADVDQKRTERLRSCCDALENVGKAMEEQPDEPGDRDDYRWIIVSTLISTIHHLLDRESV